MWFRKYIIIFMLVEIIEESIVVFCLGFVVCVYLLFVLFVVVDYVFVVVRRWGCIWSWSCYGWNCGLYYNDLIYFVILLFG